MENITKSIVYGNSYKNKYGVFLPVCSSISDRSSITNIVDYLQGSSHFSKFNRIAYAYRVEEVPVVFITEKKNTQVNYYEDFYNDQTIEGSGEKLMYLLQKFNIKNVFIGIMIQQYNPLQPFEVTNYRAIVQNSRLLLDQLYRKVINLQEETQAKNINYLLLQNNRTIKMKKCNINQIKLPTQVKQQPKERPNHIYMSGKPKFLKQSLSQVPDTSMHQITFLWERCKLMKQQYQSIIESLTERQLQQLKYFVMYDRNVLINSVIQMFCIFQSISKENLLNDYNFNKVKDIPFENIEIYKLKKMEDMIKTNRKLTVDAVMSINRAMGVLFSLMELIIRFSKTLERITDLIAKAQQRNQLPKDKSKNILNKIAQKQL